MPRTNPQPARLPFAEDPVDRKRYGRYYTPFPLVGALYRQVLAALERLQLPPERCTLVDPACGPGTFFATPEARLFGRRIGLDLDARALEHARLLAPDATFLVGDAYGDGLDALSGVIGEAPVVVVGNPPYVGNSELLKTSQYREVRNRLLPCANEVARGRSIRDDYALFFGVANRLVQASGGLGLVAYVTSSTFVDNTLYAPLRRWLLDRFSLHSLVELGPALFEGARVSTALSVWVSPRRREDTFGHARLGGSRESRLKALTRPLVLETTAPFGDEALLNAPADGQVATLQRMRAAGDRVGEIFKVTFPGLKSRFDELLCDADRERLLDRMRDFFTCDDAFRFAERHKIARALRPKLAEALAAREKTAFREDAVRRFARYAGARHRFHVPEEAMAFVYLDRHLIPRGDHRMRGDYDPHRDGPKLVFNVHEVPLASCVVEGDTCVHDHRHARFAPLVAPRRAVDRGLWALRDASPGDKVLNLATRWADAAKRLRAPDDLLYYVCAVLNSSLVQDVFAPTLGASQEPPIPRLGDAAAVARAQRLADAARTLAPGARLGDDLDGVVRELYGVG